VIAPAMTTFQATGRIMALCNSVLQSAETH
jgi:hypothetical protein